MRRVAELGSLGRFARMEALLTLTELLRTALANGAVGFTLQTGRHPLIYSAKGVQTYDTQSSTSEDIEELLRQLMTSREMRQFRAQGTIQFKSLFERHVSLHGKAKIEGDDIHVELRKIAA
jgi:Tfp pilus assembly pilus retraction ATPase PilT